MVHSILLLFFLFVLIIANSIEFYRYRQVLKYEKKALAVSIIVQQVLMALAKLKLDITNNDSLVVEVETETDAFKIEFHKSDTCAVITELINIVNLVILQYKVSVEDNLHMLDESTRNCVESLNEEMNELHKQLRIALWYENGI